ncbi:hypothetical protein BDQ17DRAFT_826360 [Cyathus striatus]|nr:hypothetical protein BDQ17DRAFT_826360 [Cyathus striatus]
MISSSLPFPCLLLPSQHPERSFATAFHNAQDVTITREDRYGLSFRWRRRCTVTSSKPVLVKDEVLNILTAVHDTASALTFCIYSFNRHPEGSRKLRQEVLYNVGTKKCPTYEEIREMAVINDTFP